MTSNSADTPLEVPDHEWILRKDRIRRFRHWLVSRSAIEQRCYGAGCALDFALARHEGRGVSVVRDGEIMDRFGPLFDASEAGVVWRLALEDAEPNLDLI